MSRLSELCGQLIDLVDRMRTYAAEEEWSSFWALDEQRVTLCDQLQNGHHTPAELSACRADLEHLLHKNDALQADVLAIKQQYQNDLPPIVTNELWQALTRSNRP